MNGGALVGGRRLLLGGLYVSIQKPFGGRDDDSAMPMPFGGNRVVLIRLFSLLFRTLKQAQLVKTGMM